MITSRKCIEIFNKAIKDYHIHDNVDQKIVNPYVQGVESLLYLKNWIDTVQWHLEDIIRDPKISNERGMEIKRRIDRSNQNRTDTVEHIDDYFIDLFKDVNHVEGVRLNTESPAWVVDRISILCLKIYHMKEQADRKDTTEDHKIKCQQKLNVLLEQEEDLCTSFDQLLEDFKCGRKVIKVYRQMKMYNDDTLNPILYKTKS